ncbi:MAG: hypothetical protein IJ002_01180 [Clostridia bacterium]|nr:hypothetical protein [Clostridia bacterium]
MSNYMSNYATFDTSIAMLVIAAIAAIAAVVLLYIFVIPEKRRENLPKIGQIAHDIFNFKTLFIEKILKFLYVLFTVAFVCVGVFSLLSFTVYDYGSWGGIQVEWHGGHGLLLLILGPIALRLVYETILMFVLLVKNVIQINNKLGKKENNEQN